MFEIGTLKFKLNKFLNKKKEVKKNFIYNRKYPNFIKLII